MSLASIANIPSLKDPASLAAWSFNHMAHHRDVNRVILETKNTALEEFVLDPMNPADMGVWLANHQIMHNQVNQVLNVDGFDLSDVDLTDPGALADWIWLNFQNHFQWSNQLGV